MGMVVANVLQDLSPAMLHRACRGLPLGPILVPPALWPRLSKAQTLSHTGQIPDFLALLWNSNAEFLLPAGHERLSPGPPAQFEPGIEASNSNSLAHCALRTAHLPHPPQRYRHRKVRPYSRVVGFGQLCLVGLLKCTTPLRARTFGAISTQRLILRIHYGRPAINPDLHDNSDCDLHLLLERWPRITLR
ncbi:hypothetical protein BDR05DRAFT_267600 [Suillus weaverae]|nr:hypothetical protein BDR05DRAFT_267600 [Suillus weaverae]